MKNALTYDISWRYKAVRENRDDPYVLAYLEYRKNGVPEYVGEALEIYRQPMLKMFIESMLLGGCSDHECAEFFGCTLECIDFYKKMYFDIDEVSHSKAKLMLIARDARPNEQNLKMCAVKFGKEFVQWFLGIQQVLDDAYVDKIKSRLFDGILLKSLGHEFSGSMSDNMGQYLKMINMVRQNSNGSNDSSETAISAIIDHFAKIF